MLRTPFTQLFHIFFRSFLVSFSFGMLFFIPLLAKSQKQLVKLIPISKYQFLVENNTPFELEFVFENTTYPLKSHLTTEFSPFGLSNDLSLSFQRVERIADPVLITSRKFKYSLDDSYTIHIPHNIRSEAIKEVFKEIKLKDESLATKIPGVRDDLLEELAKRIDDKIGINDPNIEEFIKEQLGKLFPEPKQDPRTEEIQKWFRAVNITSILLKRITQLKSVLSRKDLTEKIRSASSKKLYRTYTPAAFIDLGGQSAKALGTNFAAGPSVFARLSLGVFPEIVLSKANLKFLRIYVTGAYVYDWQKLKKDSAVFIGKDLLSGATGNFEQLVAEKNEKLHVISKSLQLGLRFLTQLTPAFYTYLEGGVSKSLVEYKLEVDNDYQFVKPGVKFIKSKYDDFVIQKQSLNHYLTIGIGGHGPSSVHKRSTRRGLSFDAFGTAVFAGGYKAGSNYQIVNSSGNPFSFANANKVNFLYGIKLAISI